MWQGREVSDKQFKGFTPYDASGNLGPAMEPEEEGPGPWGPGWTLIWGFVVFCVWQLSQLAVVAFLSFREYGAEGLKGEGLTKFMENLGSNGDAVGLVGFTSAVVGCLMIVAIVRVRGCSLADGLALRKVKKWWMWLLVFPAWIIGAMVIGLIVSQFEGSNSAADQAGIADLVQGTDHLFLLIMGVSIGAPFFEEFFFRGLLHEGLRRTFLRPIGSGILISAAFSVAHLQYQDPSAFVALFLLGCLFTAARELTGSLWAAVVMHGIQNTVVTVSMFLMLSGMIPEDQLPEDMKEILRARSQEQSAAGDPSAEE